MRRFFAMMRYSKKLLAVTIGLTIDILVMLGLIVFDVVHFVQLQSNAAMLSSAVIPINIVLIVLSVINILAIIIWIVFKRKKENLNEFKQD